LFPLTHICSGLIAAIGQYRGWNYLQCKRNPYRNQYKVIQISIVSNKLQNQVDRAEAAANGTGIKKFGAPKNSRVSVSQLKGIELSSQVFPPFLLSPNNFYNALPFLLARFDSMMKRAKVSFMIL
jgi:hypothetical protein